MKNDLLELLAPHILVGLCGTRLTEGERSLLRRFPFAGVVLFDRNVGGTRELLDLSMEIRRIYREERRTVPLIAADQEGGVVSALARAVGAPPTQMAVGRTADESLCERLFSDTARRMRSCGVNMLLGPVADINSEKRNPIIGTRSFGENEHLVSNLVAVAVSASRKEGVIVCLKHFPGHGDSSDDSHVKLALLGSSLEELKKRDLKPFARGIASGAECVMTAHAAPRGRTSPASLDEEIICGLLRGEMGFGGVVVSDALEMEGARRITPQGGEAKEAGDTISSKRSLSEICRLSLRAGNDLLLFSRPLEELSSSIAAVGEEEKRWFFEQDFLSNCAASTRRINALLDSAASREREFELPGDVSIHGEIARRALKIEMGHSSKITVGGRINAIFYADEGAFDLYTVRRFIARALRSVSEGELRAAKSPDELWNRLEAGPAFEMKSRRLESRTFMDRSDEIPRWDIVFLLNRRPLDGEALHALTEGCRAVVIAGWPYADELVFPSIPSVTTFGAFDSAADILGSFFERGT